MSATGALAAAVARGGRHEVRGRGTRAPTAPHALATTALDAIVQHEPGDQTITVEAGLGLDALRAHLAVHGQCLPCQGHAARGRTGTVGGLVATLADGVTDLGSGTPRERLLGCRALLGDGSLASGRGRVVKNVAGYDLPRLLAGSCGTLGVLVEVSLKLQPLPAASGSLLFAFRDLATTFAAADAVLGSGQRPSFVDVLASAGSTRLALGLDTSAAAFGPRAQALRTVVHGRELPADDGALRAQLDDPIAWARPDVLLRVSLLPTRCAALAHALVALGASVDARPGLGLLLARVDEGRVGPALAAARAAGHVRVLSSPRALGHAAEPPPLERALMQRVKEALDPHDVFPPLETLWTA